MGLTDCCWPPGINQTREWIHSVLEVISYHPVKIKMSIKYIIILKTHKNISDTIKVVGQEFYLCLTSISFSLVKKKETENDMSIFHIF